VPEKPTHTQALKALEVLETPFRMFPYEDVGLLPLEVDGEQRRDHNRRSASHSVVLAAVLTGLVRHLFEAAPLFGFSARSAGSGKSLLDECTSTLVTGRRPAHLAWAESDEENRKALESVLYAGDQVVSIDNASRVIRSDRLCSMLTQSLMQVRVLGKTQVLELPSRALMLITGNNLQIAGDLCRRTLVCTLDAQHAHPEERHFPFNPLEHCLAERSRIVIAALTVLRAYAHAGLPNQGLKAFGNFEQWSGLVRSALVWLGCADPWATNEVVRESDPWREDWNETLSLWHAELGEAWYPVGALVAAAQSTLREKLLALAAGKDNRINVGKLGLHLDKKRGNVSDDQLVLQRHPTTPRLGWRVVPNGKKPTDPAGAVIAADGEVPYAMQKWLRDLLGAVRHPVKLADIERAAAAAGYPMELLERVPGVIRREQGWGLGIPKGAKSCGTYWPVTKNPKEKF
jgi:hypothetical protein